MTLVNRLVEKNGVLIGMLKSNIYINTYHSKAMGRYRIWGYTGGYEEKMKNVGKNIKYLIIEDYVTWWNWWLGHIESFGTIAPYSNLLVWASTGNEKWRHWGFEVAM